MVSPTSRNDTLLLQDASPILFREKLKLTAKEPTVYTSVVSRTVPQGTPVTPTLCLSRERSYLPRAIRLKQGYGKVGLDSTLRIANEWRLVD